jgi:hypothetical protein
MCKPNNVSDGGNSGLTSAFQGKAFWRKLVCVESFSSDLELGEREKVE